MKFKIERDLTNQVFTTKIKFDSFGGVDIDAEEEQALINDFGAPVIDIGNIEYKEKYIYEPETKRFVVSEDGDEVSFIINSSKVEINDKFEVSYVANAKRIKAEDYEGNTYLNKPALIAEARCLLFEAKIREKIEEEIDKLKSNMSDFETTAPEDPFVV